MSNISNWATALVASATKKEWLAASNVLLMISAGFFAMAFAGDDVSRLFVSPTDLHSLIKQGLEFLL